MPVSIVAAVADTSSTPRWRGVLLAAAVALFGVAQSERAAAEPNADRARIQAAVDGLDGLAQRTLADFGLPGMAVAVVHEGKTVFARGYGLRELGKPGKVDADTVFQIASLSKSLAASVVAQQVGEGVLTWETPVARHLSWFTLSDPWVGTHATIGDLFSHRSGLPDHAGDDLELLGFSRREILERLAQLPLNAYRDSYAYTNFGLTTAAEAVAVAAGTDWESLSEQAIYAPLGMTRTSSRFKDYLARDNRASGHAYADGAFRDLQRRRPDAQAPAGGVSSTAHDMARWMAMVLANGRHEGKTVIEDTALLPALSPQVVSGRSDSADRLPSFYGFGTGVGVSGDGSVMLSHSGMFVLGTGTNYMMSPAHGLGIVVLSNGAGVGAVEAVSAEFMDLAINGEVTRDWAGGYRGVFEAQALNAPAGRTVGKTPPADAEASAPLSDLVGRYASAYFGEAQVDLVEGALVLMLGPDRQTFELTHWSGNSFVFPVFNEERPYGSRSTVTFDLADKTAAMQVEFLNDNGLGSFTRAAR
ncbi:serine hydrolase [Stappia stellulata]|uniref:serine hydrolase n=1 Tax=Stappia stellulata TaxID=71235 RepID=UPI000420CF61|nr:serine hydrolase [Stappia stellulata]